tara:strand:- start:4202 stop:4387 length:186 start_codon:yes stop_codon:yes gene_type:complete
MKKSFPRKPFEFGKFIISAEEPETSKVEFIKERFETQEAADIKAAELTEAGYDKVLIMKIG